MNTPSALRCPCSSVISHSSSVGPHRQRDGFALLVTITLLAFVVLLLVSLASLERGPGTPQAPAAPQHQAEAHQTPFLV